MTVEYDADKLWIEICEEGGLHYLVKYDWVVKYRPVGFNIVDHVRLGLTYNGNIKACKESELDWNTVLARAGNSSLELKCRSLVIKFRFSLRDFRLEYFYYINSRESREILDHALNGINIEIKPTDEILRLEKRFNLIGSGNNFITDGATVIDVTIPQTRVYKDIRMGENSLRGLLVFTNGVVSKSVISKYPDIDYIPLLDMRNEDEIDLSTCKNLKLIYRVMQNKKTIILGDLNLELGTSIVSYVPTIVTSNKAFYEKYKHLYNIKYKE